jgi:CBS domain-containing protein
MTLVVVDRHDSQPLDRSTKRSVTEGLQHVFSAPRGSSSSSFADTTAAVGPASGVPAAARGGGASSSGRQQQPVTDSWPGAGGGVLAPLTQHGSRETSLDVCRGDSASESIPVSKVSSLALSPSQVQLSISLAPSQPHDHLLLEELAHPDSPARGLLHAGVYALQQQQQQSGVQRESQTEPPLALQRAESGRGPKPMLTIDISCQGSGSASTTSHRQQQDSSRLQSAPAATQPRQQQQPPGGVPVQDLARRLLELGMLRRGEAGGGGGRGDDDTSSSDDDFGGFAADAGDNHSSRAAYLASLRCRSGGSASSVTSGAAAGAAAAEAGCKWQPVPSQSCGDLLLLARQQQTRVMRSGGHGGVRRSSVDPDATPPGRSSADVVFPPHPRSVRRASVDSHLLPSSSSGGLATRPFSSSREALSPQDDSSHSLTSIEGASDGSRLLRSPSASNVAAGAAGRRRRPAARRPSRIILSPVGPDGSTDPSGQPRLYVAIPKAAADERRAGGISRRASQSLAATPRVPFTPASAAASLTPVSSGRAGCNVPLKQLSSTLVGGAGRSSISPSAAAASAATAHMPYNVAVAAAQILRDKDSRASATAEAVVAARAAAESELGDSSSPLPSPLRGPAVAAALGDGAWSLGEDAAAGRSAALLSPLPPAPQPSPHVYNPPATPVHPAVAAAAAAAIAMTVDAAAQQQQQAGMMCRAPSLEALLWPGRAAAQDERGDESDDEPMQLMSPVLRRSLSLSRDRSSGDHAAAVAAAADAEADAGTATILEGTDEGASTAPDSLAACDSDAARSSSGSGSEEWWCGELTGLCVRDVMTGPVKCVAADADIASARALMMQHNLPGMLVDAGRGQAPGLLRRGDFFKASIIRRRGSGSSRKRPAKPCVRDIMSPVLVVAAGMPVEECAQVGG